MVAYLILLCAPFSPPCSAQIRRLEYEVKAAFLLNFTRFVEWPDEAFVDSSSPMTICIFGQNPFGEPLDQMVRGELVGTRRVDVREVFEIPPARTCQVLFFGNQEGVLARYSRLARTGTLTVSEVAPGRPAAMINLVVESQRVRFDIDQSAAAAAGLRLRSQLLRVARSVH